MLQQFRYKLQNWMRGRYGADELSKVLNILCIILILLSWIRPLRWLSLAALVLIGYNLFRMLSRNISKRMEERQKFLLLVDRVKPYFTVIRLGIRDRKTSRYYLCKECRKVLRVPKGRGRIEISCPHCGKKQIRKT